MRTGLCSGCPARRRSRLSLALVSLALQQLALLVLAHLLAALFYNAAQGFPPVKQREALVLETVSGSEELSRTRKAGWRREILPPPNKVNLSISPTPAGSGGLSHGFPVSQMVTRVPQPSVEGMASRQKLDDRGIATAELGDLAIDLGVAWIDHLASLQIAQALALEAEGQVESSQVQIQAGIEELLSCRRPAQLRRLLKPALDQAQAKPLIRPQLRVAGIGLVFGTKESERLLELSLIEQPQSLIEARLDAIGFEHLVLPTRSSKNRTALQRRIGRRRGFSKRRFSRQVPAATCVPVLRNGNFSGQICGEFRTAQRAYFWFPVAPARRT